MSRSAGHLIVRTLENAGIDRVYAVPGESYLDVLDGLYDSPIETVVCRQEGGAGYMALAEGRLTGRPGIVMVTRGPGAANAMIAVHTAYQDATALVLFVGLVPLTDRSRDSFQEFSLPEWFSSTAKKVITIDDEHRAGDLVADALRIAASGRPGPVVVGLPEDVLVRLTDAEAPATPAVPAPGPSGADLAGLTGRLTAAKRPAFVLGGDGWQGGDGRVLADFAAASGIPVFADWRAYDAVPHSSAAWAGWLGYGRAEAVVADYADADLLVFVGCTRTDVASEGYASGLDTETVLAVTDLEALGHAGRIDQHIITTSAALAEALTGADPVAVRGQRDDSWMSRCAEAQAAFARHRPDRADTDPADTGADDGDATGASATGSDTGATAANPGVDLGIAFGILDDRLGGEAVLTYGAGNATIWGHRFVRHERPASLVGARNGAMGLAVPGAVAASLVFPDRRAVAICGDGDFLMNGQELATAVAHGAKPLVIVIDNGVYGTIVAHQENHYPGRPSGTQMVNPDFAALIASFGGHGERIEVTADFEPALDRALAADGPALIHIVIDPATMPPTDL